MSSVAPGAYTPALWISRRGHLNIRWGDSPTIRDRQLSAPTSCPKEILLMITGACPVIDVMLLFDLASLRYVRS